MAPLLRIWIARRMSRLNRATAAARSHSCSCSSDRRKFSTSVSVPLLIQPQSRKARQRSSLWYRSTSVCRSEPLQHLRLSVVPLGPQTQEVSFSVYEISNKHSYVKCPVTQTISWLFVLPEVVLTMFLIPE